MPLGFLHIPKTAGATFRSIILKNYKSKDVFLVSDLFPDDSIQYLNSLEDVPFKAIVGHKINQLDIFELLSPKIVFLREPIERIISSYNYSRRSPHNRNYKSVREMSFENYLEFLRTKNLLNFQSQYLLGSDDLSGVSNEKVRQSIKRFDYVFVSDRFDEALLVLREKIGWSKLKYIQKNRYPKSKSFNKSDIPSDIFSQLEEECALDRYLYDLARERHRLHTDSILDLDRKLHLFQRNNIAYSKIAAPIGQLKAKMEILLDKFGLYSPAWKKRPIY